MNDRIQELAQQAKDSIPKDMYGPTEWIEKYNENLGNLIVQECAGLFPHMFTDEQYARRIDKTILKHFGVIE